MRVTIEAKDIYELQREMNTILEDLRGQPVSKSELEHIKSLPMSKVRMPLYLRKALGLNGINFIGDLATYRKSTFLKLTGLGKASLAAVNEILAEYHLPQIG